MSLSRSEEDDVEAFLNWLVRIILQVWSTYQCFQRLDSNRRVKRSFLIHNSRVLAFNDQQQSFELYGLVVITGVGGRVF